MRCLLLIGSIESRLNPSIINKATTSFMYMYIYTYHIHKIHIHHITNTFRTPVRTPSRIHLRTNLLYVQTYKGRAVPCAELLRGAHCCTAPRARRVRKGFGRRLPKGGR